MTARTEGFEELALPDLERRQANAIRYGTVAEVDYANARVKIKSGNITTAWLPWAAGRASGAKRRWDPPEVGEQVAVISPGGDLAQGLVLPGVYQSSAAAPSDSADKDSTVYSDGTVIEYDRAAHSLTADLQGTKLYADRDKIELTIGGTVLTLTAGGTTLTTPQLTVDAAQSTFTGDVTIEGLLAYQGGMTGSGGSGASIQGPLDVTGGSVTHDGKNIGSSHTHSGVAPGGGTTGAPT
jgi:phage baseplate assembly protein V